MDKLWVYAMANAMVGHNFSDDVAIVYAPNKEEAYKKFRQLYKIDISEVNEVVFNDYDIAILTDY